MEDYQPAMAAVLATALASDEANAVNEEKLIQGNLIQILTNSKAEAVRAVQRLHRNLGHPSTTTLVEMLEARGASEMILSVAREYQC